MFYTNVNGVIGAKSNKPIKNSLDEVFESDLDLDVGMIFSDGEWVEPSSTIAEIDAQLEELDNKSKRPMRAILTASDDDDTSEDLSLLSEYEAQVVALRAERAELVE